MSESVNESETSPQKLSRAASKKIPVSEIFGPTVQGEGITCGQRTVFVRFGLCDYDCVMCDSRHAVDPFQVRENAEWLTQEEIYHRLLVQLTAGNCKNVTFSGGNPCIHDLGLLSASLVGAGYTISVETQGTKHPDWLKWARYITISPKGPGMGEKFDPRAFQDFMKADFWGAEAAGDITWCLKVVIFDNRDLEFAAMLCELNQLVGDTDYFYLSLGNPFIPGRGIPTVEELTARYELLFDEVKNFPSLATARFLPQVHVLLWGNQKGK